MKWEECKKKGFVKELSFKDENLINSLVRGSRNKQKSSNILPEKDYSFDSKFILLYDSIRELLEALAVQNLLKIYNHECYVPFLRKFDDRIANTFNQIRKKRNRVNYYGDAVSKEDFEILKDKIAHLRNFIFGKLKEH